MMPTPLRIQLNKKGRALLMPWLACAGLTFVGGMYQFSAVAIGLACFGLCALSIGHEYSHRTIVMLLTQPASRRHLLFVKLVVLAGLLAALFAVWAMGVHVEHNVWVVNVESLILRDGVAGAVVGIVVGLSLVPWFTMLARGPLAGVALSGLVCLAAREFFPRPPESEAGRVAIVCGALAICGVGAVMGWRTFIRLEVTDVRRLTWPQWLTWPTRSSNRSASLTRRPAVVALFRKELRLHRIVLLPAALMVFAWVVVILANRFSRAYLIRDPESLMVLGALVVSALSGAAAGAEERHFGTIEWQSLLPATARKTWWVKVATVTVVTAVFALLLPALLSRLDPNPGAVYRTFGSDALFRTGALMLSIALVNLYAAGWNTSYLKAALITTVCVYALGQVWWGIVSSLGRSVTAVLFNLVPASARLAVGRAIVAWAPSLNWVFVLVGAAVVPWCLHFGLVNHRYPERSARLLVRQVLPIIATLTFPLMLIAGVLHLAGEVRYLEFQQLRSR
jgi:hypothetical protein